MFRKTLMSMQMQLDELKQKKQINNTLQQLVNEKENPKNTLGTIPEVTLLLSYPNSGTTYTLAAVRSISRTVTATNYEAESTTKQRLYPKKEIQNGPYVKHNDLPLPEDRILTKTHCTGYSNDSPIQNYIVNPKRFEVSCNSIEYREKGKHNKSIDKYDLRVLPKSAIRLIRDPFDNTVSNYHHWLHNLMTPQEKQIMDELPSDEKKFKRFCKIFDGLFDKKMKKENISIFIDRDRKELMRGVPCHQFFYRYTQVSHIGFFSFGVHCYSVSYRCLTKLFLQKWHNNANKMKGLEDVLLIKYDDYEKKYNETITKVLNFLHLSEVEKPSDVAPFKTGKSYRHYYSEEEKVAISKFLRHQADNETLGYISPYLTDE